MFSWADATEEEFPHLASATDWSIALAEDQNGEEEEPTNLPLAWFDLYFFWRY